MKNNVSYAEIIMRCNVPRKQRTCGRGRATGKCYNVCPSGSTHVATKVAMEYFDSCHSCGKALTCEMTIGKDLFKIEVPDATDDVYECRKCHFKSRNKKCLKCDSELVGIFFMGDKSRPPEFLACRKCHIAYDPDTLKVLANIIF